jgi:ATP-dependent DNA ligase
MARAQTSAVSMEARQVDELPRGAGWQYEPKWDGFRCLASRAGRRVGLIGRSGKTLARYFPDVVANLAALPVPRFVLDGELVIPSAAACRSRPCSFACIPPRPGFANWPTKRRPC